MKKIIAMVLCLCLLLSMTGCGTEKTVTCADVIAAYEAAGYSVSHRDYPEKEYGYLCMVRISEEDGDSIEFHFHETAEEAEAEAKERQWNALLWLFSVIYSDPTWLETETYQNIEIEYDDDALYKPFDKLVSTSWFDRTPDYPQDTFFAEDLLLEHSLSGMPVPKLENSRLNESVLYCNLTDEEYQSYIQALLDYLQARADIYHLGSYCSSYLEAEIFPYDVYSYIPENYGENPENCDLIFSLSEEVSSNGYLSDPIRITLDRGEETLGSFSYNTKIKISNTSRGAKFDPCYREHTYGEGILYPIPGLPHGATVQYCVNCGGRTQDFYFNDNTSYNITVTEGKGLIARSNYSERWTMDSCYAGLVIEISTYKASIVLVNGEEIPLLRQDPYTYTYGFIMPNCDISISVSHIQTEETP